MSVKTQVWSTKLSNIPNSQDGLQRAWSNTDYSMCLHAASAWPHPSCLCVDIWMQWISLQRRGWVFRNYNICIWVFKHTHYWVKHLTTTSSSWQQRSKSHWKCWSLRCHCCEINFPNNLGKFAIVCKLFFHSNESTGMGDDHIHEFIRVYSVWNWFVLTILDCLVTTRSPDKTKSWFTNQPLIGSTKGRSASNIPPAIPTTLFVFTVFTLTSTSTYSALLVVVTQQNTISHYHFMKNLVLKKHSICLSLCHNLHEHSGHWHVDCW